jgi:hypothetical protein
MFREGFRSGGSVLAEMDVDVEGKWAGRRMRGRKDEKMKCSEQDEEMS